MATRRPPTFSDPYSAWLYLVERTRRIYPQTHQAAAETIDKDDMTTIAHLIEIGKFTTFQLNQRIDIMEAAFPSSPTRPPKWGIRIHGRNMQNWHFAFAATYAARHFLEAIMAQTKFKWVSNEELEIQDPELTVTCEQPMGLDTIMEYKLTTQEAAYTLPTPYPQQIAQMLGRSYFAAGRPGADEPVTTAATPAKRARKPSSSETPAKPRHPDGLIPLEALTKDPKRARNQLRAANFPKPASGKWLFTEEEAAAARKVLGK